ncbi:MAG TPA: bifunctional diaminohydroxyphosphoribosylaminopyrimidine deaminase/5-amino-6-(5-phosphoribosylamino)uracil reductase RibD [Prolixibacteraceae bacterium]|nr:bifunctional diaminohydroxyphosphoribosylaminopyrimidine deaminase/5-amino-6-(5-phosphoribosylamino)uracil reductase RibD [Prolixibacteraceae bacterium]
MFYFCSRYQMEAESKYMQRCLDLAKLGEGHTAPNPMVGCVIVHDGKVIGEGFHRQCGGPHAEVHALRSVADPNLLARSTLYVNLEPCAHYGKTPPCSDLIVAKKIPRVVIGTIDPFSEVAGKGIEKLRQAGCEVFLGMLHKECRELNRRFFAFHEKNRPYIILKWAQTQDGFIDQDPEKRPTGKPVWITDEVARVVVHRQRACEGAIFIGTETALKDNPSLTLREWYGRQPLRIVADRVNRLPDSLTLFDGAAPTRVLGEETMGGHPHSSIIPSQSDNRIDDLLRFLHGQSIQSLIVEGGAITLQDFIDRDLWDEAHVYTGKITFGSGIRAPRFKESNPLTEQFPRCVLHVYRNHRSTNRQS